MNRFGERRIYYNNFASHLLNAYNPNMLYPALPYRWSLEDWKSCLRMVSSFGFNVFEFWLVPDLFSREGLAGEAGKTFREEMNQIVDMAHDEGLKVEMMIGLATVGQDWKTLCPNDPEHWLEIQSLWDLWTTALPGLDIVGIFPGDPGGCSLNGCTALTYIDRSIDICGIIKRNLPRAEIEFGTWGPPFFAWGIIEGPRGWNNEFVQEYQHTAWRFSRERMERSMNHLLERIADFPEDTGFSVNMGFNPDCIPSGENSGIPWAREIAKTRRIQTWDFSLTEGENAILPHYRLERLFAQRRREREAAPYSGGICFTMTPALNQLSLYESAVSFINPDARPAEAAKDFYRGLFGKQGEEVVDYLSLFEVIPDWGNHSAPSLSKEEIHRKALSFVDLLVSCGASVSEDAAFFPSPDAYRRELLWYARLFAELSSPGADYDELYARYWGRVYGIYDALPEHVDPRPVNATRNLVDYFRYFGKGKNGKTAGKWTD
jgi:hypothetical protein